LAEKDFFGRVFGARVALPFTLNHKDVYILWIIGCKVLKGVVSVSHPAAEPQFVERPQLSRCPEVGQGGQVYFKTNIEPNGISSDSDMINCIPCSHQAG
jgi:hypothetical protein